MIHLPYVYNTNAHAFLICRHTVLNNLFRYSPSPQSSCFQALQVLKGAVWNLRCCQRLVWNNNRFLHVHVYLRSEKLNPHIVNEVSVYGSGVADFINKGWISAKLKDLKLAAMLSDIQSLCCVGSLYDICVAWVGTNGQVSVSHGIAYSVFLCLCPFQCVSLTCASRDRPQTAVLYWINNRKMDGYINFMFALLTITSDKCAQHHRFRTS